MHRGCRIYFALLPLAAIAWWAGVLAVPAFKSLFFASGSPYRIFVPIDLLVYVALPAVIAARPTRLALECHFAGAVFANLLTWAIAPLPLSVVLMALSLPVPFACLLAKP